MDERLQILIQGVIDEKNSAKTIADQLPSLANEIAKLSKIKLQAEIDSQSMSENLQATVKKASQTVQSNQIKITPVFDTKHMDVLQGQLEKYAQEMAKLNGYTNSKVSINTSNTGALKSADIQYYNEALKQTITDTYRLGDATDEAGEEIEHLALANRKFVDSSLQATKAQEQLNQQVLTLKRSVGDFGVKNKGFLSGSGLDGEFKKQYQEIVRSLTKINDPNSLQNAQNAFKDLESYIKRVNYEMTQSKKLQDNISDNMVGKYAKNVASFDLFAQKNSGYTQFAAEIKQVQDLFAKVNSANGARQFSKDLNIAMQAAEQLKTKINQVKASEGFEKLQVNIQKAQSNIENFTVKWSKIKTNPELLNEWNKLVEKSKELSTQADLTKFNAQVGDFSNRVAIAGANTKSFADQIKNAFEKFGIWLSVGTIIMQTIRTIKDMVNQVIELDTAMTELYKVTDETDNVYGKFLDNATDKAKELGASITDIVNSSADFARLGYSIDESLKLAEASTVYKNVGDGITDIATSTESIVSTMKAFGIEAQNSMHIVDAYNAVGNAFASSSADIGSGLKRSASALASANNTFEESIGLFIAANQTIQDADVTGTALKTISMRLRNSAGALEELSEDADGAAESVTKLQTQLLNLTGGKVNIFEADNTTFKSTFDIITDISKVWNDLTDKAQADITRLVAGQRQANVFAALVSGMSEGAQATTTALNSQNSALTENQKYLDSINGRLEVLKATYQELANNTINGDFVKGLISVATALLEIVNTAGGLIPVLTTVLGILISVKAQSIASFISKTGVALASLLPSMNATIVANGGIAVSSKSAAVGLSTTGTAATGAATGLSTFLGVAGAVVSILSIVYMAYSHWNADQEESRRKSIELASAAKEQADQLSALYSEYKQLSDITEKSTEQDEEFKSVQQQLVSLLGDKADILNTLTEGTDAYTEAVKKLTIEELKNQQSSVINGVNAAKTNLDNVYGYFDTPTVSVDKKYKNMFGDRIASNFNQNIFGDATAVFGADIESYKDAQTIMQSLVDEYNKLIAAGKSLEAQNLSSSKMWIQLSSIISDLQNPVEEYIKYKTEEAYLNEVIQNGFPETISDYNTLKQSIFEATGASDYFKNSIGDLVDSKFPQFANYVSQSTNQTDSLAVSMQEAVESLSGFDEQLSNLQTNLDKVISIQESLANGNALTYSQYKDLISVYPELNKYIDLNAKNYGITVEVLDEVRNAMYESEKASIQAEINKTQRTAMETSNRIKQYEAEIRAIEAVVKAQFIAGNINDAVYKSRGLQEQKDALDALRASNEDYEQKLKDLQVQLSLVGQSGTTAYSDIASSTRSATDALQEYLNTTQSQISAIDNLVSDVVTLIKHEKNERLEQLQEMLKAEEDANKKALEAEKDAIESSFENREKILEDYYDNALDQLENYYDDLQDREEAAFDDRLDQLNAEDDAIKKQIDLRKELLQLAEDELQYQRQLSEKSKSISSIQGEIAELSFDDTREAQNRVRELQDQLAQEQQDLDDLQRQHTLEGQLNALDDEYEAYHEIQEAKIKDIEDQKKVALDAISAQKDAAILAMQSERDYRLESLQIEKEAAINSFNEIQETRKTALQQSLEDEIAEIQQYLDEEGTIRKDAMALIDQHSSELYDKLLAYNSKYGESTDAEVTRRWNEAYEALGQVNNGQLTVLSTLELLTNQMYSYEDQIAAATVQTTSLSNETAVAANEAERLAAALVEAAGIDVSGLGSDLSRTDPTSSPLSGAARQELINDLKQQIQDYKNQITLNPARKFEIQQKINELEDQIQLLQLPVYHDGTAGAGGYATKEGEIIALLQKGEPVLSLDGSKKLLNNIASLAGLNPSSYINNNSSGLVLTIENLNIKSSLDDNGSIKATNEIFGKIGMRLNAAGIKLNANGASL